MSIIRIAIIMAGGSGERFWPLSRQKHPKQLLRLADPDMSLLQEAVRRLDGLVPADNIFIATARHLRDAVLDEGGLGIPAENVIAEPCKRNTTGCLCYAAAVIANRYADTAPENLALAVLTADHSIGDTPAFQRCADTALAAAVTQQALVTIGIRPTRAETGYGHIEFEADSIAFPADSPVHRVIRFLEKPDADLAERFFRRGNFLWNSGMFFWTLASFKRELAAAQPVMAQVTEEMAVAMARGDEGRADELFASLESISIDYALMEKAATVLVVPALFPWDDVGAWDALERTLPVDTVGNVVDGDSVVIDCSGSVIYNAARKPIAVAAVGVEDLVIVVSDDAVLVVPKNRAQDVKQVVQELKDRGATQV
ncbi:MAG: sugar phosphate nucleotidyltransferase [Lentisphaeria bacterium]|nr:sugar phosphate nucleotidyltransferase [Lentisphaeria bacterium]